MNGIFSMIFNQAVQRLIGMGVRKGTNAYAKRTADGTSRGPRGAANKQQMQKAMKLARLAARASRGGLGR